MSTIKYKDKEYELKRLSLAQELEQVAYLRKRIMDEVKLNMVGLPLELCKHCWDAGRLEALKIDLGSPEYKDAVFQIEAIAYALILSLGDKALSLKDGIEILSSGLEATAKKVIAEVLGFPLV